MQASNLSISSIEFPFIKLFAFIPNQIAFFFAFMIKVLGYIPFIGALVGLSRITFSLLLFPSHQIIPQDQIMRGCLETIPFINLLLIFIDYPL